MGELEVDDPSASPRSLLSARCLRASGSTPRAATSDRAAPAPPDPAGVGAGEDSRAARTCSGET